MIDLHTHSTASDGTLTPARLVEKAAKMRMSALALTDHDTTGGLEEASSRSAELDLRFIPGIELEIDWSKSADYTLFPVSGEFHLLGLNITKCGPSFTAMTERLRGLREARNERILALLRGAGIDLTMEEVLVHVDKSEGETALVGRPHFAAALVDKKIVKTHAQAFEKFLGKGKPCFSPKGGEGFEEAASLIHEAGGLAILAHPSSLRISWGAARPLLERLKILGLDGVEAWHPNAAVSFCTRMEALCRTLGLRVSAGSDFHGNFREDRQLGHTAGGSKIDERFLAELFPGG